MSTHKYSPTGFPTVISEMIGEAAMRLPPLTRPQDGDFLRDSAMIVMDAFWENYVASLPKAVEEEYRTAESEESLENMLEWMRKYADFQNDQRAEELGSKILTEIADKLPEFLPAAYNESASPSAS